MKRQNAGEMVRLLLALPDSIPDSALFIAGEQSK